MVTIRNYYSRVVFHYRYNYRPRICQCINGVPIYHRTDPEKTQQNLVLPLQDNMIGSSYTNPYLVKRMVGRVISAPA